MLNEMTLTRSKPTRMMKNGNKITDERDPGAGDIQTHCGFREPLQPFGSFAVISHKCDRFMAARNMVWSVPLQDYVTRPQLGPFSQFFSVADINRLAAQ